MGAKPFLSRHGTRLRKASQGIFLVIWSVLWVTTARLAWPAHLVHLPAQLDPLLGPAQVIASRTVTGGFLFGLITLALTLVFGRAWCGWICPVGTVLDIFSFKKPPRAEYSPVPENLRKGKFLLLAAVLTSALFGSLTLLIFDPITLWIRTLTGGIGPALNTAFTAAEDFLANVPGMDAPLQWLDQALRPAVFPDTAVGIRYTWLPVLLFAALILLNLIADRFWCRYLCPLGGLLGWVSKAALVKRRVNPDCVSCGLCARKCPTRTIDPARGYASDPAECTLCLDCAAACPVNAVEFPAGFVKPEARPYDPQRRELLASGAVTLLGLAVLQTGSVPKSASPFLLRPPGAKNDALLQSCLRCGLCLRACPTGALQASLAESGWIGLFTPVIVPRLGYCLYSCNACGQVCPVEAIPPLALEDKQQQVIGKAFIDQNRCIPWADGVTCIVCEEMCPLPEKAISLEERQVQKPDGASATVQLPRVMRERCIGCGICEYKCPRAGEAAIRVRKKDI